MKISIDILNDEVRKEENNSDKCHATWYSRGKSYESDTMDGDMINSTVGFSICRIRMDDFQITSKSQIDDIICFLENAKESLIN